MANKINVFNFKLDPRAFKVIHIVKDLSGNPYIVLCRYIDDNSKLSFMHSTFKEQITSGKIINKQKK